MKIFLVTRISGNKSIIFFGLIPEPHLIPAIDYFSVNNLDLVKQLSMNLIEALQYFFLLSTGDK